jgi:hypothetical protein
MLPTVNVYADTLSEILAAVCYAQTYGSQFIHGYSVSDTVSTIYICGCCLGLNWYTLFTNITIHTNTHMFIQMMKMLLQCFMKLHISVYFL